MTSLTLTNDIAAYRREVGGRECEKDAARQTTASLKPSGCRLRTRGNVPSLGELGWSVSRLVEGGDTAVGS